MWTSLDMTPDQVANLYQDRVVYLGHCHSYPIYFHERTSSVRIHHPGAIEIKDKNSLKRHMQEFEDVFNRARQLDNERGHGAVWIRRADTMERKLGSPVPSIDPSLPKRHPAWIDSAKRHHFLLREPRMIQFVYFEEDNSWWLLGRTGYGSTDVHELNTLQEELDIITTLKLDLEKRTLTPAQTVDALQRVCG